MFNKRLTSHLTENNLVVLMQYPNYTRSPGLPKCDPRYHYSQVIEKLRDDDLENYSTFYVGGLGKEIATLGPDNLVISLGTKEF